jgi:hypothetical protein
MTPRGVLQRPQSKSCIQMDMSATPMGAWSHSNGAMLLVNGQKTLL